MDWPVPKVGLLSSLSFTFPIHDVVGLHNKKLSRFEWTHCSLCVVAVS